MVYWPLNPKEAVLKETSELLPSSSTALLASTVQSDVQVHPSDTTISSLLVTPFPCCNKNTAQLLNYICTLQTAYLTWSSTLLGWLRRYLDGFMETDLSPSRQRCSVAWVNFNSTFETRHLKWAISGRTSANQEVAVVGWSITIKLKEIFFPFKSQ